jgi:hypothetical protein
LAAEIAEVAEDTGIRHREACRIPNVEIFHKAVDWALRYGVVF